MKFFRLLPLTFQNVLEQRSRAFVWFIISVMNPVTYLLFWQGAIAQHNSATPEWNKEVIYNYYFLSVIITSLLITHQESWLAEHEINQGFLSAYLMKPYSFYLHQLVKELPWRLLQGFFGIIVFLLVGAFNVRVTITHDVMIFLLALAVCFFGFFISYTFKMIVAFTAFWTNTIFGLQDVVDISLIVLGGLILPIHMYPGVLRMIAESTPFAYMIYYPIMSIIGRFSAAQLLGIISIQAVWFTILYVIYRIMWNAGLKRFTAVGQ